LVLQNSIPSADQKLSRSCVTIECLETDPDAIPDDAGKLESGWEQFSCNAVNLDQNGFNLCGFTLPEPVLELILSNVVDTQVLNCNMVKLYNFICYPNYNFFKRKHIFWKVLMITLIGMQCLERSYCGKIFLEETL